MSPGEPRSAIMALRRKLMFKALHGAVNGTEKAIHVGFAGLRRGISYLEGRDEAAPPPAHQGAPADSASNHPEH